MRDSGAGVSQQPASSAAGTSPPPRLPFKRAPQDGEAGGRGWGLSGGEVAPPASRKGCRERRAAGWWHPFGAALAFGGKMDEALWGREGVVLKERGVGIWKANSSVCTLNKCHAVLKKLQRAVRFQSIS